MDVITSKLLGEISHMDQLADNILSVCYLLGTILSPVPSLPPLILTKPYKVSYVLSPFY